jgi:hypothetical protein
MWARAQSLRLTSNKRLYAFKGQTLGGLVAPTTYTQGKASSNSCVFFIKVVNHAYTAPNGLTTTCYPPSS